MTKFDETEIPTRPDWPTTTAARRCKFCGLVYGEHIKIKGTRERLCPNTKTKYEPKDHSDGDETR